MRKRLDKGVGKKLKGSLIIFANRAQVDGRLKARLSTVKWTGELGVARP